MRMAIDTGGTFTDCVFLRERRLQILKLPSVAGHPEQAIAAALRQIASSAPPGLVELTIGTTVGTNALLERRCARVALVTTAGFEDVIEIGRQARPRLYDLFVTRPQPLAPRKMRFGLRERIAADGTVLLRPGSRELRRITARVARSGAESVAVCLLFSFLYPGHEKRMAASLKSTGLPVSLSHQILPEFREYERTVATLVNACLLPVMSAFLGRIQARRVDGGRRRQNQQQGLRSVHVMQSSGGIISAAVAAREPVRTVLSGPAGGVLGAQQVAAIAGFQRIISFDMGGTSTDVAMIAGPPQTSKESFVAGLPIAVPVLDIHTVGAGGGSIARFDRAGALRVGPESAGVDPGPICYGRGEHPTVTDAHLLLGRFGPEGLLGGQFPLDAPRAQHWMERARGALPNVTRFAQGILHVVGAAMEKAIRVVSLERGHDPAGCVLVAFGGAGGLHACALAAALRIPAVLIPKFPGALSALGIFGSDVVKDLSQTVLHRVATLGETRAALAPHFERLTDRGRRAMRREGFPGAKVRFERALELRYLGQAFELTVPAGENFLGAFHREHQRRYGYADRSRSVEVVNVRLRCIGRVPKVQFPPLPVAGPNPRSALDSQRQVFFGGAWRQTPIFQRERLRPGNLFVGPAMVAEYSATTAVPPGWSARVDQFENLVLRPSRAAAPSRQAQQG